MYISRAPSFIITAYLHRCLICMCHPVSLWEFTSPLITHPPSLQIIITLGGSVTSHNTTHVDISLSCSCVCACVCDISCYFYVWGIDARVKAICFQVVEALSRRIVLSQQITMYVPRGRSRHPSGPEGEFPVIILQYPQGHVATPLMPQHWWTVRNCLFGEGRTSGEEGHARSHTGTFGRKMLMRQIRSSWTRSTRRWRCFLL